MSDVPVLAVLGGSFDPPHIAHVLIPTYLISRGLADRVLVAPCYEHALGKDSSPFADRLRWTRAAMEVHGHTVWVSDIERSLAERTGRPSYALELCRAVAAEHPEYAVRLVVGSDIIESGETARWHEWESIEREFPPIVIDRAGHGPTGHAALPEVSSTQVRAWMKDPDAPGAQAGLQSAVPAVVRRLMVEPHGPLHIVGTGNVATHAARWLRGKGFGVVAHGRDLDASALAGEGVWLLVGDRDLPGLATAIAEAGAPPDTPFLHAAGSLRAADALAPLARAGHPVGTLHPICSLRKESPRSRLARAAFGLEGDPAARSLALELVGHQPWFDLQGFSIEQRTAYHAACALVANHLAVIEASGAQVFGELGLDTGAARQALGVLMLSSVENLLRLGIPDGVTGPAVRGESATVQRHIDALGGPAATLYRDLSARLFELLGAPAHDQSV